jgi:cytochrome c-type biogenesis protein CcmE
MKPKHKRLIYVLLGLASVSIGSYILLNNFKDNLVYFYAPKDLIQIKNDDYARFEKISKRPIRVGGMVKSYKKISDLNYEIIITDYYNDLKIVYEGLLPPMFREKQGVVAQGQIAEDALNNPDFEDYKTINISSENTNKSSEVIKFKAKELITKHDEKYMPPEIERSLKKDYESKSAPYNNNYSK